MKRRAIIFLLVNTIPFLSFSQFSQSEIADIQKLVLKWSQLQSQETLSNLASLYDGHLIYFYGNPASKGEAIESKRSYFERHENYRQEIVSSLQLSFYPSFVVKCSFDKKVFTEKKSMIYSSYLLIQKEDHELKIIGESDLITDANLNKKPAIGEEIKNTPPKSNDLIYTAIIISACCICTYCFFKFRNRKKNRNDIQASTLLNKEDSEEKGKDFEKFIVKLFNQNYFKIEAWRSDKYTEGIYAISNMHPDMEIEYIRHNPTIKFAIECKWRKGFYKNGIQWAKDYQVKNYKNFQADKNKKVFVIIGLGGEPTNPESVFIIPLDHLNSEFINRKKLEPYKRIDNSKSFYLDIISMQLK